jgi:hypothetical protein
MPDAAALVAAMAKADADARHHKRAARAHRAAAGQAVARRERLRAYLAKLKTDHIKAKE